MQKNQATSSISPGNIDHLKIHQFDWQNCMRYYLITEYRISTGTQKMIYIVITEQILHKSKVEFFNNINCHYRINFAKSKDKTF